MNAKFEMSDLGLLTYYLGIEVCQHEGKITLKQEAYAKNLLSKTRMLDCNPTKSPMEHKLKLRKDEEGESVNPTEYRSLVGGLRYLTHTRPDISFAVGIVSRFMEKPMMKHLQAVKAILRYVKGTLDFGLTYVKGEKEVKIVGFTDSDLANDINDRKSTGGMAFYVNENLITWASQKQKCVALSSCEAEFMAATLAACQGVWLRRLLSEITGQKVPPVVLSVDNRSALDLMKNPVFHGRSKHIDIRFHFIRECVENGEIIVKHVSSDEQKADILTKPLGRVKHEKMRNLLGIKKCSIELQDVRLLREEKIIVGDLSDEEIVKLFNGMGRSQGKMSVESELRKTVYKLNKVYESMPRVWVQRTAEKEFRLLAKIITASPAPNIESSNLCSLAIHILLAHTLLEGNETPNNAIEIMMFNMASNYVSGFWKFCIHRLANYDAIIVKALNMSLPPPDPDLKA
ncbi:hypothetical protein L2E82_30139 [Cichorium intybus]|uniref:Uncharacterized protein n=1 Tax=Cichorium intybus TaxID=13427 RepID=A0ACB9CZZ0_CICIN|nr:hypothetical protein L2E82_30139 [Cichorium intybus]